EQLDEELHLVRIELEEAVALVLDELELPQVLLRAREETSAEAGIGEDAPQNSLDGLLRHLPFLRGTRGCSRGWGAMQRGCQRKTPGRPHSASAVPVTGYDTAAPSGARAARRLRADARIDRTRRSP